LFCADRRTDGRTDMTKLVVAFRNFANAPKNQSTVAVCCVIHIKMNRLCEQKVELLNVKLDGTFNNNSALKVNNIRAFVPVSSE
jgi:hypothetical protein